MTSHLRSALTSLALTALAVLALAATASGATEVSFDGHVTPVIREVPKRPLPMRLRIVLRLSGDEQNGLPPTLERSVVHFPYGSALNGRLFPSCDPNTINRRGPRACPPGSSVGRGHATGVGVDVRQRLAVELFNGRGGRSVIFHLRGSNPLRVNTAFTAPLRRLRGGRWNFELTVDVPENLKVVAGVELSLVEFVSTVHATRRVRGRRRGYIEAWSCPPGARVPLRGRFLFINDTSVLVNSWIRCG
jgi:hypothetical protein